MQARHLLLIATAILLLGFGAFLLPKVEAQVGTSSLSGTICASGDPVMYAYATDGSDKGSPVNCMGPLPNATVHLTKPGPLNSTVAGVDKTATTDEGGAYSFSQLPDGNDFTIAVSRVHFTAVSQDAKVQGASSLSLSLAGEQFTQIGQVVSATDGRPVAGAQVSVCCAFAQDSYMQQPVRTDANGDFAVTLRAGYQSFYVSDAGGFQDLSDSRLAAGSPITFKLQALPAPDAFVVGTVRDQDGNTLAGIRIDASGYCCPTPYMTDAGSSSSGSGGEATTAVAPADPARPYYVGGSNHTTTASDGTYRLGVYTGQVNLNVNQEGFASRYESFPITKGETQTHDMKLLKIPAKTAHIVGQVTNADTGNGLRAVAINLRSPAYGIYECSDNGLNGGVVYYADAKPMDAAVSSMPIRDPGQDTCAIQIGPDGRFSGNVTPGYTVVDVYYQSYIDCPMGNQDGKSCPEYFTWTRSLTLASGTDRLDIALVPRPAPDATVSGYVVDAETSKAIPGATLWFWNQDNSGSGTATTDQDGSYKVRLRAGYTTINVNVFHQDGSRGGYLSWQGLLQLEAGDTSFDIPLTAGDESNGGCCSYGGYGGKGGIAPMESSHGQAAAPSALADSGQETSTATQTTGPATANGFEDLKGGLGPYDAESRSNLLDSDTKQSPHIKLPVLLGLIAGLAFIARRRALSMR